MTRLRAAWLVAVPVASVTAQQVHYEGGLSANTGRYIFTERTTSLWWTNGLSVRLGSVTVRGSLPIAWQNNILITASGAGPIPSGGGGGRSRAVSDSGAARRRRGAAGGGGRVGGSGAAGMLAMAREPQVPVDVESDWRMAAGDPTLGATIRVWDRSRTSLTVGAIAKVPIADTARFGTGQWDVGAMASLALRADHRTMIAIDGSVWHLGDLAELDFRDPVTASVSFSRLFGSSTSGTVFATAGTTALDGFAGPASAGLSIGRLGSRGAVALTFTVGLSETSPEIGGGVSWRIGL